MSIRMLFWCLSGLCALSVLLALAATVAPDAEQRRNLVFFISGAGAVLFGMIAARASRLPAEHWLNRSLPRWASFTVLTVLFAFLLVSLG